MKRPNPIPNLNENMLPLPDHEAFNKEIHELFVNGDLSHIARFLRKDQSAVSRAFNPFDDSRHSPVFELMSYLWAMDCHREGLGDAVLSIVTREREKWLIDGVEIIDSPAKLTADVGHELIEAIAAEIDGAPLDKQIQEWDDVEQKAREKKQSAMRQRGTVHGLRAWAGEKVNGRGK